MEGLKILDKTGAVAVQDCTDDPELIQYAELVERGALQPTGSGVLISNQYSTPPTATEGDEKYERLRQEHLQLMDDIQYKVFTSDEVKVLLETLWERIEKYKDTEDGLLARIQDQEDQLATMTTNMTEANAIKDATVASLAKMEQDVTSTKKKLDASHLREQDYQELVTSLRNQTKALEVELEKTRKEQEELAQELGISGRSKEAYYRDKERLKHQNADLKREIQMLHTMQEELGKQLVDAQSALEATENQLTEIKMQNAELVREKGVMGRESLNQKLVVKRMKKCLVLLKTSHDSLKTKLENTTSTLEEQKKGATELKHETKEMKTAINLHLKEMNDMNRKMSELLKENSTMKREDEIRERHYRIIKKKLLNIDKIETKGLKAIHQAQEMKKKILAEKAAMKTESKTSCKNINEMTEKMKKFELKIADCEREKKTASAHLLRAAGVAQDTMKQLMMEQQVRRSTELERDRLKVELHRRFMDNVSLMAEKERLKSDWLASQDKVEEGLLHVKHKENQIINLKKDIADLLRKQKKAMYMYDETKSERNIYANMLSEIKEDNENYKKMFKQMTRLNEQLKEQLSDKDNTLIIFQRDMKKKEGEIVKVEMRLSRIKSKLKDSRKTILNMERNESKKSRAIEKADSQTNKIKSEMEQVRQELAKLLTQLDRKSADSALLKEKIDTLDFVLKKGETEYNKRIDDIKLLKIEILKLRREKGVLLKAFENTADLRNEIFHLSKDLNEERQRVKCLEQQMETPLNFHRWRFLEGTDPERMELIQKVNILQKKLISSTTEIGVKDYQLSEIQRCYNSFKAYLDKMPGFEAFETIEKLKRTIRDRDQEIKTLSVQLASREGEVSDMKIGMDVLKREIEDMKKKYYELKLKEDYAKQKKANEPIKGIHLYEETIKEMLGGGFRMSIKDIPKCTVGKG